MLAEIDFMVRARKFPHIRRTVERARQASSATKCRTPMAVCVCVCVQKFYYTESCGGQVAWWHAKPSFTLIYLLTVAAHKHKQFSSSRGVKHPKTIIRQSRRLFSLLAAHDGRRAKSEIHFQLCETENTLPPPFSPTMATAAAVRP